jgi:GR25 family glycosyltransferase involved in LPS biosynthesis
MELREDKRVFNGVDIKRFQYEEYANHLSDKKIDILNIIGEYLLHKKVTNTNCLMINLEKDIERYDRTLEEYKKVSIVNFSHLKGTYWKERDNLVNDLNFVLYFLKEFNSNITEEVTIDDFSQVSDPNIYIQDGPLACYISHLRAMIWGYHNNKDYTIITEDDISITNTEYIEEYLKQIPDDWDIVLLNACSKNKIYESNLYKFEDEFHSTHFYIINNRCFSFLFKNLYPITDQVDVLISNLYNKLNIYNIEDCIYQRNISTNTQNNLWAIFNSPHYKSVRDRIKDIQDSILYFMNKILQNNELQNEVITLDIMYDVIYEFVLNNDISKEYEFLENKEDWDIDVNQYSNDPIYDKLVSSLTFFLQCTKKGIIGEKTSLSLVRTILYTINKFTEYHSNECKSFGFGSTAHTYLKNNIIIKKYNQKLRWITDGHNDNREIFEREISLLQAFNNPKIYGYNKDLGIIEMEYCGVSLYQDFNLPDNWNNQIIDIFSELDKKKIYYPEFRLQNILVLNDKITFIDYGLAQFNGLSNSENCKLFIDRLEKLNYKLKNIKDRNIRLNLISSFFINLQ